MEENNQNKEPLNKDFKVPKLRFSKFIESWKEGHLFQLLVESKDRNKELKYNVNDVLSVSREKGVCKQIELLGRSFAGSDLSNYHVLKNMEIVYTKSPLAKNPYGIIQANRINSGIVSTMYAVYYVKEYNSPLFIEHYFSLDSRLNNYLKPLVNIGAKHDMKIKNSDVLKGKIYYPSYTEQCKISYLFEILNKKINVLESKIKTLKKYKEGLVNLCFCDGKRYKISSFVKQVEKRNKDNQILTVYSISNKKGFISQTEQFDGNEVASTNKTNYKIVRKNEFAYNPARVNVGSIAYLEEEIGQISPMYIVFSIHGISNILLDEYFHSIYFRKELRKHLEGSVRQSLSFENLCDFNINISNFCESFSLIFEALNCKLSILEKTLLDLKKIKSYLLENMFI